MVDTHLNLQETKCYLPAISRSYGLWSELSHHAFFIFKVWIISSQFPVKNPHLPQGKTRSINPLGWENTSLKELQKRWLRMDIFTLIVVSIVLSWKGKGTCCYKYCLGACITLINSKVHITLDKRQLQQELVNKNIKIRATTYTFYCCLTLSILILETVA